MWTPAWSGRAGTLPGLGGCAGQAEALAIDGQGFQQWAHVLGFGGHFSTESRRYSTTLTALRAVRKAYHRGEPPEHPDTRRSTATSPESRLAIGDAALAVNESIAEVTAK